jgi:TatD DNase family protein
MLIDSHAHIDSEDYAEDREAMLVRAREAGVAMILAIGIGEGPETMHRALDLTRQYANHPRMPRLVASAGVHPHHADRVDRTVLETLESLAAQPEVIAIGEIGLDYYYENAPRDVQRQAFIQQMDVAREHALPILIHCRDSAGTSDAWEDLIPLLQQHWQSSGLGGVLHCFGGSWKNAQAAMDMGFLLSFAGNVTFAKAGNLREVAAQVPADRILTETDAPFLAPAPNRGKRNEPAGVRAVAEKLAEVRGVDYETMALTAAENFRRFFGAGLAAAKAVTLSGLV